MMVMRKIDLVVVAFSIILAGSAYAGQGQTAAGGQAINADQASFSQPTTVANLDMKKLKGQPARLAWSPDGTQFYLQTLEGDFGRPNQKLHHYVFNATSGAQQKADNEPAWASEYWTLKSGQASPDNPAVKIELKTEERQQRTTSAPMGGDLARGVPTSGDVGTSAGDAGAAAYGSQNSTARLMVLKGATIGEFVNAPIVPGLTFGWGPRGSKAIAYVTPKDGRVVVMDADGKKKQLDGTGDAILPAWSADGRRLAWLRKDGRKNFVIQVANVSGS
jgi:hypothetical protein